MPLKLNINQRLVRKRESVIIPHQSSFIVKESAGFVGGMKLFCILHEQGKKPETQIFSRRGIMLTFTSGAKLLFFFVDAINDPV